VTAAQLAALVGGRLVGQDKTINGVGELDTAQPHELAFAERSVPEHCRAGVLLVSVAIPERSCVVVEQPKQAFIKALRTLFPERDGFLIQPRGVNLDEPRGTTWVDATVHPTATVDDLAILAPGVVVHAGAFVAAHCRVGPYTVLYPNVVLYPGTTVGARCRIHAGTVIGADGFSYERGPAGPLKVVQVGCVSIGDDVEIGPNCVIDRAFLGVTRIGDGAKLDGLVMVGHNVQIGRGALIAAQVGLAGSVEVGDDAMLGGQSGVADHRKIGAGSMVAAQSGVGRDVPDGQTVLGSPAMPLRVARRVYAYLPRLPDLVKGALKRD